MNFGSHQSICCFSFVVFVFSQQTTVLPKLIMVGNAIIAVRLCPAALLSLAIQSPRTTTMPLIDSQFARLFVANVSLGNPARRTIVSTAVSNSEPTTATFAICGCRTKNHRTTVPTVVFVASVVETISNTATSVACALTGVCTNRTIARPASTGAIVQCVKSICSVRVGPRTKCPADTPFTGTVSVNWRRTIPAVPFVKRRPKRANA